MTGAGSNVANFQAAREAAQPEGEERVSVAERIRRKKDLLTHWLANGVDEEHAEAFRTLPESLNSARTWSIPETGILPIKSPNAFVAKSNPDVQQIAALLTKLHKRYVRPKKIRGAGNATLPRQEREAMENAAAQAASRYHQERAHRLEWERRALSAEAKNERLSAELTKAEARVVELEREARLRNAKVIS